MKMRETSTAVVLEPNGPADAALIWLHGLGADGHDFVPIAEALDLGPAARVRFVFPHAPVRPVTLNQGMAMRAWYDIVSLDRHGLQDEAGIRASEALLRSFVEAERGQGIAAERIVIAGFSQGGAVALHTALRYPERLGGILALSSYLPIHQTLAADAQPANRMLPIAMYHGRYDPVIPLTLGHASAEILRELGYPLEWRDYPMQHEVSLEEIGDIASWLRRLLGF